MSAKGKGMPSDSYLCMHIFLNARSSTPSTFLCDAAISFSRRTFSSVSFIEGIMTWRRVVFISFSHKSLCRQFRMAWHLNGLRNPGSFSAVVLLNSGIMLPAAISLAYGFLTIRKDETAVVDFIGYAARFFISGQQYFEWRAK